MITVAEKIEDIELFASNCPKWYFRGHKCINWKLETSLERAAKRLDLDRKKYEGEILKQFKRSAANYDVRCPKLDQESDETVAWLAFMQHYGAPTRLLDFTYSFWIALFFAIEEAKDECKVWALNPSSLGDDNRLPKNNDGKIDLNQILFDNIYDEKHIDNALFPTVPFFTLERLAIQQGVFVFSLDISKTFYETMILHEKETKELIIPSKLFPILRKKLNDFNCNSRVLFPGIDGYARYFQNHTF